MFYQLENVSSKYGAPMGRNSYANPDCTTAKIHFVPLVDGYDNGGAYWGDGYNLYAALGDDFALYLRAENITEAKEMCEEKFPDIRFEVEEFEEFLYGYATAALFSSNDDQDEPLDSNFSIEDIHPDTIEVFNKDCREFLKTAAPLLPKDQYEKAGRYFWYNRNGHGIGFWDGEFGDVGDDLNKLSHEFGEVYLFTDDGKVHQE